MFDWIEGNPGSGRRRIREAVRGRAANVDAAPDFLVKKGLVLHLGRKAGYVLAPPRPAQETDADALSA